MNAYAHDFKYDTIEPKYKPRMIWPVTTTKPIHLAIPKQSPDYVQLFDGLVVQWRKESQGMSAIQQITDLKSFKAIVSLREKALPLIYKHLQIHPSLLVVAGIEIAGYNPTPQAAQGNIYRIVDSWLRWAEHTGANAD